MRSRSFFVAAVASTLAVGCSSGKGTDAPPFTLDCSAAAALPVASPGADVVVDGAAFPSEAASTWSWSVTGGACDQLLETSAGAPSFTVAGASTPQLTLHPTLPGDYAVALTASTADATATCTFPVRVRAPGLRVALCWDTTGTADLDLHLHRSGTTTPWFTTTTTGSTENPDDCFYSTCLCAAAGPTASWGYAASSLAACEASRDGACWATAGSCRNPRLEQDNVASVGLPEIAAVDGPSSGATFRIMAHYYSGAVAAHPLVSIFCGDAGEVASLGAAPDLVTGFDAGGGYGAGPMWRAADVTLEVDGTGTTTGCSVQPLHPPGAPSGYWVTTNDRSF